jgi:uncharacterized membrane protein
MTKHKRQITATRQHNQQSLQHAEEVDDSLLPDAAEIEKLHSLDPQILPWLKARAEQEQTFRQKAFLDRNGKIDNQNKREHNTIRYGLTLYSLLVGLCIAASYFLLDNGHSVQGSLFGGAAIVLALAVLVSRKTPSKKTGS